MKKNKVFVLCIGLILAAAIAWGGYQRHLYQKYTRYLASMYDRSFYELIDSMDNIEVKLEKLLIAENSPIGQELIADIWRQSYSVSEKLSIIPQSVEKSRAVMSFVNKLGEYLRSLLNKECFEAEDKNTISQMLSICKTLNQSIEDIWISEKTLFVDFLENETEFWDDFDSNGIDYPTLIYDGPFSDASKGEAKALKNEKYVDINTAQENLINFLGNNVYEIENMESIEGEIPCYCFQVINKENIKMTAAVTKKGGKMLWMISDELPDQINLQLFDAIDSAAEILSKNNFPDMHLTHWQVSDASVLLTFTAVFDDVILYPDMVKMIISLKDGSLIGLDTGNYYRNHVERDHFDQLITSEEAIETVGNEAFVKTAKMCVVPINGKEIYCHELTIMYDDALYYKYIDALTGDVIEVLKLISTEYGNMVI